jgi:hypothetical protein
LRLGAILDFLRRLPRDRDAQSPLNRGSMYHRLPGPYYVNFFTKSASECEFSKKAQGLAGPKGPERPVASGTLGLAFHAAQNWGPRGEAPWLPHDGYHTHVPAATGYASDDQDLVARLQPTDPRPTTRLIAVLWCLLWCLSPHSVVLPTFFVLRYCGVTIVVSVPTFFAHILCSAVLWCLSPHSVVVPTFCRPHILSPHSLVPTFWSPHSSDRSRISRRTVRLETVTVASTAKGSGNR